MDSFSRQDLDTLLGQPRSPSVSLYLTTHRAGPDTQQDPLELTNLIHRAQAELMRGGLRRPAAEQLLAPARDLGEDERFWRDRGEGLAVFLRDGWWRAYRLPVSFDELVVVADRFRVYPLLPLLSSDRSFFVLALSENEARLYRGTRSGLRIVPVPCLPHGVADALRYDQPLRRRNRHFGVRAGVKVRTVVHGQGIGGEIQKERLGRYLHAVSGAIDPVLAGERRPLVLAGVDHVRAAYREITRYPHVLDAGIAGSPDRVPPAQLHARAWELAGPEAMRGRDAAAARYREAAGTGLASDDVSAVVVAAEAGRVECLFLPVGSSGQDDGVVESAAIHTLRTGGNVYAVSAADVPGGGAVAAVFRY
ncbi:hypothetical protein HFP15_24445 [Amycolatopsis sp. K13G38]|uniref:Peptide chain release factor 1 n=1 Tax=Amycolatopsis acididurans TaxID=2724524 RepID=A0ABX1JAV5_9PSEU|nr:hypothetical protein [Amycolatopsis acididurans]NKQ56034.1 hypothetical protein [Amycolatopsis acididurans]